MSNALAISNPYAGIPFPIMTPSSHHPLLRNTFFLLVIWFWTHHSGYMASGERLARHGLRFLFRFFRLCMASWKYFAIYSPRTWDEAANPFTDASRVLSFIFLPFLLCFSLPKPSYPIMFLGISLMLHLRAVSPLPGQSLIALVFSCYVVKNTAIIVHTLFHQ